MRILAHTTETPFIYINHVCQLIECVMRCGMWVTWSAVIEMECSLPHIQHAMGAEKHLKTKWKRVAPWVKLPPTQLHHHFTCVIFFYGGRPGFRLTTRKSRGTYISLAVFSFLTPPFYQFQKLLTRRENAFQFANNTAVCCCNADILRGNWGFLNSRTPSNPDSLRRRSNLYS